MFFLEKYPTHKKKFEECLKLKLIHEMDFSFRLY